MVDINNQITKGHKEIDKQENLGLKYEELTKVFKSHGFTSEEALKYLNVCSDLFSAGIYRGRYYSH